MILSTVPQLATCHNDLYQQTSVGSGSAFACYADELKHEASRRTMKHQLPFATSENQSKTIADAFACIYSTTLWSFS